MRLELFIYKHVRRLLPRKNLIWLKRLRVGKFFTFIFGPVWVQNYRRIEIDITYECVLKCLNCDRSCRQAPSSERISVEQIKRFSQESIEGGRKWEVIRVLGGEPTLHPDIIEILNILADYKKSFSPATLIQLVTSGYGTHSDAILHRVPAGIEIVNTNKKNSGSLFWSFNLAPLDAPGYRHADFSNGCDNISVCGLGFNKYGYYPCAAGAGIDRVFGFDIGKKKLPSPENPTKEQLKKLCRYCGYFCCDRQLIDHEMMSPVWREAYEKYKNTRVELTSY